ncbi:hypothetical protein FHR53_000180 [Xanthomonas arboricola]
MRRAAAGASIIGPSDVVSTISWPSSRSCSANFSAACAATAGTIAPAATRMRVESARDSRIANCHVRHIRSLTLLPQARSGRAPPCRSGSETGDCLRQRGPGWRLSSPPHSRLLTPNSQFPIPNSRLPTPDSRFPIPDSRLPTPDSRFPTPDSRLPTPDSRFPIPDSRLPIPDSRFPIPDSRFPIPDSRFPIPDSRFPIPGP